MTKKKKKKTTKKALSKKSKKTLKTVEQEIDALLKLRPDWAENLTFNEMCYVMCVANPQSASYGNYTRSWIKAGYPDNKNSGANAHRLQSTDKIQNAIDAFRTHAGKIGAIARPQLLDMALSQYHKADKAGDRMACLRSIELIARIGGYNQDKLIVSSERQALLDETQLIEQQRLSSRLIEDHLDLDVVETTATVVDEGSDQDDKRDFWAGNEE
jgi:hypothetical protein